MASARNSGPARAGRTTSRTAADQVALGDRAIDIAAVVRIARDHAQVGFSKAAQARLSAARAVVERFAASDVPIYGLTTGLGAGVDTRLGPAEMGAFQARAIRARSVGVGS